MNIFGYYVLPGVFGYIVGMLTGFLIAGCLLLPFEPSGERLTESCKEIGEQILKLQESAQEIVSTK